MNIKKLIISIGITCLLGVLLFYKIILINKEDNILENSSLESRKEQAETNLKHPEKETIHGKMLNSIDYFKNCEGEYEEAIGSTDNKNIVKYAIDVENQMGMSSISENNSKERTVIFANNKKLNFDDNNNTYREFEWKPVSRDEKTTKLSTSQRVSGQSSGNLKRLDSEFLGYSSQSLLTEWSTLLARYNDWEFEETKLLDLDCYKLTGVIDKTLSESLQGKFEMVVEKSTGILLDFKSYDENGNIKYYLTTKKINIDKGIDASVFKKDNSKYQKIDKVNTNK